MGPSYMYRAKLDHVVDGDSFVADVDLGFGVSATLTLRLHGVDAAQALTIAGIEATTFLLQQIDHEGLLIRSHGHTEAGWVCDVWVKNKILGWVGLADLVAGTDNATATGIR